MGGLPSATREALVPTCWHWSRMSCTHSAFIGRARRPLSPPTMTQLIPSPPKTPRRSRRPRVARPGGPLNRYHDAMNDQPDNLGETGDRDRLGRFVNGHPGLGGRPRALDLRAIAETKAAENDVDLPTALWEVVEGLLDRAKGGDPQAAKVLFDRLVGPVESRHLVAGMFDVNATIKPGTVVATEMKEAIRSMLGNPAIQSIMMAEMKLLTDQQGPPVPKGRDLEKWMLGFLKTAIESGKLDPADVTEMVATTKLWPHLVHKGEDDAAARARMKREHYPHAGIGNQNHPVEANGGPRMTTGGEG